MSISEKCLSKEEKAEWRELPAPPMRFAVSRHFVKNCFHFKAREGYLEWSAE